MISTLLALSLTADAGPFGDTTAGEKISLVTFPTVHIEVTTQAHEPQTHKVRTVRTAEDALHLCNQRVDSTTKYLQERQLKILYIDSCQRYEDPSFPDDDPSQAPGIRFLADIYLQP